MPESIGTEKRFSKDDLKMRSPLSDMEFNGVSKSPSLKESQFTPEGWINTIRNQARAIFNELAPEDQNNLIALFRDTILSARADKIEALSKEVEYLKSTMPKDC